MDFIMAPPYMYVIYFNLIQPHYLPHCPPSSSQIVLPSAFKSEFYSKV